MVRKLLNIMVAMGIASKLDNMAAYILALWAPASLALIPIQLL